MGSGCNIGCKTLFSERSELALKLTCLAGTSTCPATLLNKGNIEHCPKHYLPSGTSQGLLQLAPLPFFAEFTCKLQRGQWLCCTLGVPSVECLFNFRIRLPMPCRSILVALEFNKHDSYVYLSFLDRFSPFLNHG